MTTQPERKASEKFPVGRRLRGRSAQVQAHLDGIRGRFGAAAGATAPGARVKALRAAAADVLLLWEVLDRVSGERPLKRLKDLAQSLEDLRKDISAEIDLLEKHAVGLEKEKEEKRAAARQAAQRSALLAEAWAALDAERTRLRAEGDRARRDHERWGNYWRQLAGRKELTLSEPGYAGATYTDARIAQGIEDGKAAMARCEQALAVLALLTYDNEEGALDWYRGRRAAGAQAAAAAAAAAEAARAAAAPAARLAAVADRRRTGAARARRQREEWFAGAQARASTWGALAGQVKELLGELEEWGAARAREFDASRSGLADKLGIETSELPPYRSSALAGFRTASAEALNGLLVDRAGDGDEVPAQAGRQAAVLVFRVRDRMARWADAAGPAPEEAAPPDEEKKAQPQGEEKKAQPQGKEPRPVPEVASDRRLAAMRPREGAMGFAHDAYRNFADNAGRLAEWAWQLQGRVPAPVRYGQGSFEYIQAVKRAVATTSATQGSSAAGYRGDVHEQIRNCLDDLQADGFDIRVPEDAAGTDDSPVHTLAFIWATLRAITTAAPSQAMTGRTTGEVLDSDRAGLRSQAAPPPAGRKEPPPPSGK